MTNVQVFEGNRLETKPPTFLGNGERCRLLGRDSSGAAFAVPLSDELLSSHLLFVGGIGTGKTNAIFQLLSQLRGSMTDRDVMLIFDTKGDFHKEFYRSGDTVISNDSKATGPCGVDYWNIFGEIGTGESIEANIVEIAKTLFHERTEKTSQPFFPNAAKDLFCGILTHFARSGEVETMDNARLRSFLDQSASAELRALLQSHADMKAMVSYIADDRSPQTQGVLSELQQMVREILIGNFRKPGTISVRNAIRSKGGRCIFIEYDLGIGNLLTPIYRLLLDLAIKESLCREKSDGNVWFVIDEFRLLPNLQHVDSGVNFGRSLGAKFLIGAQSIEQIFHGYGESLARSILSGFMTTVAFRVNDATTREFVKGLFGKNRKREAYMASVQTRGITENVRDANVVEDWDIANLATGKAILGVPGNMPFLFQFDRYK
ncbi:MAG: type IV secretion system DNA-binding domain-containing protein [Verrucomicrobia bacterium]|nr:type IV secretion system DNA-binding domain-containing protein [Verrucomicrobiota bacterium]